MYSQNNKDNEMNKFDKIRNFCNTFRILLGVGAIAIGVYLNMDTLMQGEFVWSWFYLGLAPLIAGLCNFCPLCIITQKCTIKTKKD